MDKKILVISVRTLATNAFGRPRLPLTFVVVERELVRRVALYVKRIAAGTCHCLFECPLTHTPILFRRAPIRLSGQGAKVLTFDFVSDSFQTYVVRPGVSLVRAALAVARVSRRRHTRFTAASQRTSAHGRVSHSFPPLQGFFCDTSLDFFSETSLDEAQRRMNFLLRKHKRISV